MRIMCYVTDPDGRRLLVKNNRHHPIGHYTGIPGETSVGTTPEEEASFVTRAAAGLEIPAADWREVAEVGGVKILHATHPIGQARAGVDVFPLFFSPTHDFTREPVHPECKDHVSRLYCGTDEQGRQDS